MTRTRADAWSLTQAEGDWPQALRAYATAVTALRARDPQTGPPRDQLSWSFLAAMHGRGKPDGSGPDMSNRLWNKCQHGSWYFFPWHRMYVLAFETIVQHALEDEQWSLPYWYSVNPDDESTSILPPAFREPGNSLHTEHRSQIANNGLHLPNLSEFLLEALATEDFSTAEGTTSFGGGERASPAFNGEEIGLLEGTPHGGVHGMVGNDYGPNRVPIRRGWMGSPYTAAQDPIFWLHHANIDRLWQVWLDHDARHLNPAGDSAWANTSFSFPNPEGGLTTWRVIDVLDTEALGYRYESTDAPSGLPAREREHRDRVPDIGLATVNSLEPPPQVIGATQDVELHTSRPVDVELAQPVDLGLAVGDEPSPSVPGRIYLRIEGMTGSVAAPVYEVHVNVPPEDSPEEHPELRAGSFSTFGLEEASQRDELHDAAGLTATLEITPVRDVLAAQGLWDASSLRVSFTPIAPIAEPERAETRADTPPDLRAAQVTVVAQ